MLLVAPRPKLALVELNKFLFSSGKTQCREPLGAEILGMYSVAVFGRCPRWAGRSSADGYPALTAGSGEVPSTAAARRRRPRRGPRAARHGVGGGGFGERGMPRAAPVGGRAHGQHAVAHGGGRKAFVRAKPAPGGKYAT